MVDGRGFAVLDLETTGLYPGKYDRVVEVGVVLVDSAGTVSGEWSSLVNPGRDVGPTSVHGLRARDLTEAPSFTEVAAELAALLAGRVPVAHNLSFDARFLAAEYAASGYPKVPLDADHGVCTMRLASRYLPGASRRLDDCCACVGWEHADAHAALSDARAAARLLAGYLDLAKGDEDWLGLLDQAPTWSWPSIGVPAGRRPALTREQARTAHRERAGAGRILGRLLPTLPRVLEPPMADPYLAVLDDALADRRIDTSEADALVAVAGEWGLDRPTVEALHVGYLTSLARAAWEDGVVTDAERQDLVDVADLLGLPEDAVDEALRAGRTFTGGGTVPSGSMQLKPGDRICFTGEMSRPREELQALATAAGLVVTAAVSGRTAILVCADADSLSGKARKARDKGVTIVSEPKFHQLVAGMTAG
jgi:DNA polymerase-3 subunit epsilon